MENKTGLQLTTPAKAVLNILVDAKAHQPPSLSIHWCYNLKEVVQLQNVYDRFVLDSQKACLSGQFP